MNMSIFLSLRDRIPTSIARRGWNCDYAAKNRFPEGPDRGCWTERALCNLRAKLRRGPPVGRLL